MSLLRISLEQWQTFVSIVKEGSFLNASLSLNKTQPSVSYSIQKIEQLLDVKLFVMQGRKSVLSKEGRDLYLYATKLVQLAYDLEQKATGKINCIERRIRIAVDEIFPTEILMQALNEFSQLTQDVTVVLYRGILSGPCDMLEKEEVDIAITYKYPKNMITDPFFETSSALFASPTHRLSQLNRVLTQNDLLLERQIIVMDTNRKNSLDYGWLNDANAWYVDSLELKLQMLVHGLGYAWLNESLVANRELNLIQLTLEKSSIRKHKLYLAYHDHENKNEMSILLIELLKKYIL